MSNISRTLYVIETSKKQTLSITCVKVEDGIKFTADRRVIEAVVHRLISLDHALRGFVAASLSQHEGAYLAAKATDPIFEPASLEKNAPD